MSFLPAVEAWIWFSALATLAGWVLSAIGELNRAGYVGFVVLGAGLYGVGRKFQSRTSELERDRPRNRPGGRSREAKEEEKEASTGNSAHSERCFVVKWRKMVRRFRKPLPLAFAVLAVLVILGGALYAPNNHAGITYRVPRVLHWLAHGGWFWIHSENYRMNDRACGIEWQSAPLLLFTNSDRALFLLNFIPFMLMPGQVFSLFTRLGVRPRVSWYWMWLLPTGYNFLLQAGSIGNDTSPTVFALAALDYALRARVTRRPYDLGLSLLAAGLLTGAKASNLLLLLPWALIVLNLLPVARAGWLTSVSLGLLAILGSFLPTALLNAHYCGDWSGLAIEKAGMDMKNPWVGLWGNPFLLLLANLSPPFFPAAGWWNQHGLSLLPHFISAPLVANFETGFHLLWELPAEDWSGIGFGLSWLLIVTVIAARGRRRASPSSASYSPSSTTLSPARGEEGGERGRTQLPPMLRRLVLVAPWIALLGYSMKSGMATSARVISPYYPLLLPLLLTGWRQAEIVRMRWFQTMAGVVVALAFPVLILTPARPLWPAQAVLSKLAAIRAGNHLLERAERVYSVYAVRSDPMANVRRKLDSLAPAGLKRIGFMARGDDTDISFWRPYGQGRVVEHFLVGDSAAEIRKRRIEYAVVGEINLDLHNTTFEAWQRQAGAELLATATAVVKATEPPQTWYIVRLPP